MSWWGLCLPTAVVVLTVLSTTTARTTSAASEPASKYLGPGSCSASACHGGVSPHSTTKVLQNEYSTWITSDRHAGAYRALADTPAGKNMARILKLDPQNSQKCLVCHALSAPPAEIGRKFDISEGVSCENCHGPSSAWLGPHTEANMTHAELVNKYRLYDTKNLILRSQRCLSCHLGTPDKQVDHEMIAAGHPDLVFELDSYTAAEPPHWIEKTQDKLFGVRAWSTGQAVQLRMAMERLSRRARSDRWPEYAEMDCFACHHSLTPAANSWRQQVGYQYRPGAAPFNPSRFVVFHELVTAVDPQKAQQLEAKLQRLSQLFAEYRPNKEEIAATADQAAALANSLAAGLENMQFDQAGAKRLLQNISANTAVARDERSAEQIWMALDSLAIAYSNSGAPQNAALRQQIDGLAKELANPSAYNALAYAQQLQRVHAALR